MIGTIPALSLCAGTITTSRPRDLALFGFASLASTGLSAATTSTNSTVTGRLNKTATTMRVNEITNRILLTVVFGRRAHHKACILKGDLENVCHRVVAYKPRRASRLARNAGFTAPSYQISDVLHCAMNEQP